MTITNHGKSPENFFLDPRENSSTVYPLIGSDATNTPVPLPGGSASPSWIVPAETSELAASAVSTVPMTFDFGEFGDGADPDVPSFKPGSTGGSKTPSLTVTSGTGALSPGLWSGVQAPPATHAGTLVPRLLPGRLASPSRQEVGRLGAAKLSPVLHKALRWA